MQSAGHSSSKHLDYPDPSRQILFLLKSTVVSLFHVPSTSQKGWCSLHVRTCQMASWTTICDLSGMGFGGYMFYTERGLSVGIGNCVKKYWYWTKINKLGPQLNIYWGIQWYHLCPENPVSFRTTTVALDFNDLVLSHRIPECQTWEHS